MLEFIAGYLLGIFVGGLIVWKFRAMDDELQRLLKP
jgi:hypothetical protein